MIFSITTNTKKVKRLLDDLEDLPREVVKEAYKFYKDITPINKGNARRKTYLRGTKIESRYPYAGELDDGKSPQAPEGMTKPTIKEMKKIFDKKIDRLNR